MDVFDLIVIGSGAGLNVASSAAANGLKTLIIEKGPLGGTCLNRGCIPSKIVIHSAEVAETINNSEVFGIKSSIQKINFKKVTDRANLMVDGDARNIENALKKNKKPLLVKGTAKFVGKYEIEVKTSKGKKRFKGKKILLAAGARPFIPPLEGLDKVPFMTSTEALRQKKLPKSMIIIGGGYIGCELGNFYGSLGCKITILQRGPLLLSREDKEVAETFTKIWEKKFNVVVNASATKVVKKGNRVIVSAKVGNKTKKYTADKLLVATGVKPNSDLLEVEKAGVKVNKRGFVSVNKFMETNVKNIWALGDLSGVYMFRHSANLEADHVAHNVTHKNKLAVNYYPMPHAVFTHPQIAGVGKTEQELESAGVKYQVGKAYYKNTGMGAALDEKNGFAKFLVKGNEILGFHAMGPNASVLLHQVLIAMKASRKNALKIIQETVHVHPALNEVVQRAALRVQ